MASGQMISVTAPSISWGEEKEGHRKIEIEIINGFYLVEVGCKKLIFDSDKKLAEALALYRKDPQKAKEKYAD